jgi:hypothetical protein
MASTPQPSFGRRTVVSVGALGLVLGLGGCFQDHFMESGGDDPPGSTSDDEPDPAGSSGALPGTTAAESADGSTGEDDLTTGDVVADDSTSGSGSTGEGEESDSSTGVAQDESTGGVPVLGVDELVPGDLVVTEVMWNPHCGGDACEWIEILNATASPVNLLDLYVQDIDQNAGNQGRVTADVIVEPGELAVITRGVSFWPYDFTPDAVYGPNPGLNNGEPDSVVLRNSTAILDETASFWSDEEEGVAWSLSGDMLDATSNDASVSWCGATAALVTVSTTEYGSPGVPNESCAG